MIRLFVATSVAAVLVACATSPESGPQANATIIEEANPAAAARPAQIERMGFTVPIPEGWEEVKGEQVVKITTENGAAMANPNIMPVEQDAPGFNQANIVIRYVTKMDIDPKDPAKCQATAKAFARGLQSTVDSANIVSFASTGETCQISLTGNENSQRKTRITILPSPNNNYVLTCYHDGRDTAASAACDQTLQAFTFKPVAAPEPAPEQTGADGGTPTGSTDSGGATGTPDAGTPSTGQQ